MKNPASDELAGPETQPCFSHRRSSTHADLKSRAKSQDPERALSMSKAAVTYLKTLDAPHPALSHVLRVIANATFDDSGLSRLGQRGISKKTGYCLRSIVSKLAALEAAGYIVQHSYYGSSRGRKNSTIELVGFLDWMTGIEEPENTEIALSPDEHLSAKPEVSKCKVVWGLSAKQGVSKCKNTPAYIENARDTSVSTREDRTSSSTSEEATRKGRLDSGGSGDLHRGALWRYTELLMAWSHGGVLPS